MAEKIYTWCPEKIAGLDSVGWNVNRPKLIANFRDVLWSTRDERPLQRFFEQNPVALLFGLVRPHTAWVIPHPSLPRPQGGGGVPDFIVCEWSSIGPKWILVELESPKKSPVTKTGVSAICNHAVEQINDYRRYLRDNALFLRDNGWPEIHGECDGVVVIGRRTDARRAELSPKLAAFKKQAIEIVSYDRLLEQCAEKQDSIDRNDASLKRLLKDRPSGSS
jgi:hypothetical protein